MGPESGPIFFQNKITPMVWKKYSLRLRCSFLYVLLFVFFTWHGGVWHGELWHGALWEGITDSDTVRSDTVSSDTARWTLTRWALTRWTLTLAIIALMVKAHMQKTSHCFHILLLRTKTKHVYQKASHPMRSKSMSHCFMCQNGKDASTLRVHVSSKRKLQKGDQNAAPKRGPRGGPLFGTKRLLTHGLATVWLWPQIAARLLAPKWVPKSGPQKGTTRWTPLPQVRPTEKTENPSPQGGKS